MIVSISYQKEMFKKVGRREMLENLLNVTLINVWTIYFHNINPPTHARIYNAENVHHILYIERKTVMNCL